MLNPSNADILIQTKWVTPGDCYILKCPEPLKKKKKFQYVMPLHSVRDCRFLQSIYLLWNVYFQQQQLYVSV